MGSPDIHQPLPEEVATLHAVPVIQPGEQPLIHLEKLAQLPPAEILKSGMRIIRSETIPVSKIIQDESIIDEQHSKSLQIDFQTVWGQTSPINVRARLIENEDGEEDIVYDISDGYHRAHALRELAWETARAEVTYNATDAELYHHRMLAANSVASVQFARTPIWLEQAFKATKWGQQGMRATQAFAIVMNDSQRARNLDIPPDEIAEIKEWVKGNCKTLKKPVSTQYLNLLLVENADPELAVKVREREGGEAKIGNVTPGRLKAVVTAFPGEEYYAAQNAVMQHVRELRLNDPITAQMAKYLRDNSIITPDTTAAEAYDIVAEWLTTVDISTMFRVEKTESAASRLRLAKVRIKELERTNVDLERSLQEMQGRTIPSLRGEINQRDQEIVALSNQNRDLQRQNTTLRNTASQGKNGNRQQGNGVHTEGPLFTDELWYRTDPRVGGWERKAVDAMLKPGVDLEEFARMNGKSMNEVIWAVRGVFDLKAKDNRPQRVLRRSRIEGTEAANDNKTDGNTPHKESTDPVPPIDIYRAPAEATTASSNGRSEVEVSPEQHEPSPADVHATILVTFIDKNADVIKSRGLNPIDEGVVNAMDEFADVNGVIIDVDNASIEVQRVKALSFAQEKLHLPPGEYAEFTKSLSAQTRDVFSYLAYLRKERALVDMIRLAVEDQKHYFDRRKGNIGPKA